MPAPMIACVHIPRFAVEVERQRQEDAGTRLILIGEGTVFDVVCACQKRSASVSERSYCRQKAHITNDGSMKSWTYWGS